MVGVQRIARGTISNPAATGANSTIVIKGELKERNNGSLSGERALFERQPQLLPDIDKGFG
jgi:hypothetical protein